VRGNGAAASKTSRPLRFFRGRIFLDRSPRDHLTPSPSPSPWASSEGRARTIVDDHGVEWEVYDEGTWSIQLALDWDVLPQTSNPGLLFVSGAGRRRLWPCPEAWKALADPDLLDLLARAKALT
jgi:hypothetical protein